MMGNQDAMGGMSEMMSKMMGGGMGSGMPPMDMMTKMMPQGIGMMLSQLPKRERLEFAKEMVALVVEKGCEGLTKEERDEFFDDLVVDLRPEAESE